MNKLFVLIALAILAGCATPPPHATPSPPLRATLDAKWFDAADHLRWPDDDGFAAAPAPLVLPPGMLLDRFGSAEGRFFSPKGAGYSARALPYDCALEAYTAYRVKAPLVAWTGRAAPWFDEKGGATQFETDASAAQLVADGTLEPVSGASSVPCPLNKK